jgi:uncharacterized membrane protein
MMDIWIYFYVTGVILSVVAWSSALYRFHMIISMDFRTVISVMIVSLVPCVNYISGWTGFKVYNRGIEYEIRGRLDEERR